MEKQNCHFIPKVIINRWKVQADDKVQTYYHNGRELVVSRNVPKRVMVWTNLYHFSAEVIFQGKKLDIKSIEEDLGRFFEDRLGKFITKMDNIERRLFQLDLDDTYFAHDVHRNIFLRNPTYYGDLINGSNKFVVKNNLSISSLSEEGLSVSKSDDFVKFLFKNLVTNFGKNESFRNTTCWIYKPKSKNTFILCDNPNIVYTRCFDSLKSSFIATVYTVLSPNMVLIVTNIEQPILHIQHSTDESIVKKINSLLISKAEMCVVDIDDSRKDFITKNFKPKLYFDYDKKNEIRKYERLTNL